METHLSRSDAGLVHLIPEPGELGSTSSGDATNLQDSSSDAPCGKSQRCPNCSPLGAGSVQQRIWSPLLLLFPVSATINVIGKSPPFIYMENTLSGIPTP